jgi:cysteine synthase
MNAAGENMSRRNATTVDSIKDFDRVQIYGKAEWCNTGGSVKDRPALRMIEDGERSGALSREKIILDSICRYTGIAYAWIGAVKRYRVQLAVPRDVSQKCKRILRASGERHRDDPTGGRRPLFQYSALGRLRPQGQGPQA